LVKSRSVVPQPFELAATQLDMSVPPVEIPVPMATSDFTGPTPSDLLARAAELGPARPSMDSIVLPSDPILQAKSQPEIAARRAKLRRIVKGLVGACGVMCIAALILSIVSGSPETANAATTDMMSANAPAQSTVPVEKMAGATRAKAAPTFVQNAVAVRGKLVPRRR
jgi:hypothetical protein